jgi:hypothetical protein
VGPSRISHEEGRRQWRSQSTVVVHTSIQLDGDVAQQHSP